MSMSINGWAERASTTTHATARTTATSKSPSTLVEPQPQVGASLIPRMRATSQAESKNTPDQLILPGVRTCDSGTTKCAATPPRAITIMGIQNSQW